jgi:2-polyprenyl-3-methyl-5-hydroxy-6-metoxy-1,4-benzoquinol methylase
MAALEEITEFRSLPRVTSDCVPFRAGGKLLICRRCNATQSPADDQWLEEIREIYSDYQAYHQSGGVEQSVLDAATGELRGRSEVLLARLATLPDVPRLGKVVDVGCGTGATLSSFSKRGGWRLYGLEIDSKNLASLKRIDGFEELYTCAPVDLPGEFDLVTMVHSLEHFPDPLATLRDLRGKIAPGGRIFVEVPNAEANPFDYVIADHMMHFTPSSLSILADHAGFAIDCLSTTWVAKELSMTALPRENSAVANGQPSESKAADLVFRQIDWLHRFVQAASKALADSGSFGLFGTSIAATWLCSILGDGVSFFVEEDASRVGRHHMGRPVISPIEVAPGSVVFMALAPQIAIQIASRLWNAQIDMRLPPSFEEDLPKLRQA